MYGSHGSVACATIVPLSVGTLFTIGWVAMAAITLLFLIAALVQLVRPTGVAP